MSQNNEPTTGRKWTQRHNAKCQGWHPLKRKFSLEEKKIILLYIVCRMVVFHFWHWRIVRNVFLKENLHLHFACFDGVNDELEKKRLINSLWIRLLHWQDYVMELLWKPIKNILNGNCLHYSSWVVLIFPPSVLYVWFWPDSHHCAEI